MSNMKTKIIPFDLETAKKIQAGEIEGKIVTNSGETVRIICFDAYKKNANNELIALVKGGDSDEAIGRYKRDGHLIGASSNDSDLVLEVPDNEPQFKPFDKVLVRQSDKDDWRVSFYSHFDPKKKIHVSACLNWYQCIPYEGNEHLVGTTDKPKEE